MIKIAIAQNNFCVGGIKENSKKIIDSIKRARAKSCDLIVFSELSIVGYPPEDLLLKKHFIDKNLGALNEIKEQCRDIIACVGFVNRDKNKIYNSCAIIQNRKIVDIYNKIFLPNYGVFDEKRYFQKGDEIPVFIVNNCRFAVTICQDIWESDYVRVLKKHDFDFVVNLSASPFQLGKFALREKLFTKVARDLNSFVVYCNLVGGQDELIFDGTSTIISPKGKILKYAKRFQEDFVTFKLNKNKSYPEQKITTVETEEVSSALRLGLYDYVYKNNFKKVIVGLSGGIDSAVVVSLAVLTLGKKNVEALLMPSKFTSKETFNDSIKICKNLGIKYFVLGIDDLLNDYLDSLKPFFKGRKPDITEENLQA
ncbi:MAG: NAD(+) synthase, partial [Candidatus Omnitrophica bacterium]|nr:NAD(+) synthase [Candidatus Omnitrophota bacterium]